MRESDNRESRTIHPSPADGSMTEEAVINCLKGCQSIVVDLSQGLFKAFLQGLDQRLSEYGESAKTNQEQTQFFETQRDFQLNSEQLERHFSGYLGECYIRFKKRDLDTHTGEEKFQGDMLSLVENEDLEETIAISSITRRAETYYGKPLWALNQRFSTLVRGEKVSQGQNPVDPIQFCESLRKALQLLKISTKAKILAYKIFDKTFINHLDEIYEQTNQYLIRQGILPDLRYSASQGGPDVSMPQVNDQSDVPVNGVNPLESPEAIENAVSSGSLRSGESVVAGGLYPAPDPSMPSDQYQSQLVDAIRLLQGQMARQSPQAVIGTASESVSSSAGHMTGGSAGAVSIGAATGAEAVSYSSQQLVGALQNLQTQSLSLAVQVPGAAFQSQNINDITARINQELKKNSDDDSAVDAGDMHTIDLVGMLFEYMLSDDNLPDSVKAILSYLHTPFLKIAFIDTGFFQQTEHPARLLLNGLAEAGVRWVSNDGSSQYDIYDKIKSVVSKVLEDFKNDVRLFAELLLDFSAYTKKISRRQDLMERRAMEKVQGEEKLREVKMRVNDEVRARTDGKELPSAVLLLLLQPWSDYLAFILLRYGEQSDSWQDAMKTVEDILWSIQPKEKSTEKARQMEMHDDLLDVIETGFETIGYDQAKGKKLLDALFSLQKMALQSKTAEPAPAPMRDKLETMAAEKAGQKEQEKEQPTPEEVKMVENLKMIEFGTWFEFNGGKRLKVAWYNSKTLHYMLVDQMGKKVAMKTGLELAREMLKGHAKVIAGSTKPFFERALENIFHSLNAKAGALSK